MLVMRRKENWDDNYNITIETEEGMFTIFCSRNGDLEWCVSYVGQRLDIPSKYTFFITKENMYLYDSFDRLYTAVKENKPFSNSILENEKRDVQSFNNTLFINDRIEWHSDGFEYDEASILTISKENERYKVEFELSPRRNLFSTLSVSIWNSNSRYYPYNTTFMNMYNELLEYDYDKERYPVAVFATDDKKKVKKL